MARLRGAATIAALAALAAGGCLFEPRSAELPGSSINYLPDFEPAAVMENLDKALEGKDVSGYLTRIGEGFRYVPDSQTQTDFPAVDWANWDRAKEEAFVAALINNVQTVESALREVPIFAEPPSGNSVEWEYIYTLKVTSPGQTTPTSYRGRAFFRLEIQGPYWRLVEWRDVQGEADPGGGGTLPTSGALRGSFS